MTVDFACSTRISLKYNQQDATFSRSIYFYKLLYTFQAVPPFIIRSTKLYIQRQVLLNQYCCSAAGSSIGLTIPDAARTVLCSYWWAEEPPETCRAIYRNKQIEKTLNLLGSTLEIYLRCTDIWTSKFHSDVYHNKERRRTNGNAHDSVPSCETKEEDSSSLQRIACPCRFVQYYNTNTPNRR